MLLYLPINTVIAKPLNVLDCLDGEEDCLELDVVNKQEQETDESNLTGVEQFDSGSVGLNIVKMIFALLLVLVLIYVVVKFLSSRQKLNNRVTSLENLGGISVGNNKSIQIIRIGKLFYLIGVGENVELLKEITDPEVVDTLLRDDHEQDGSVSSLLTPFLQNKDNSNQKTNNFKDKFAEELDKIKHHRKTLINKHTEKEDEHD